jgi:sialic acid synthase SpsE
MLDIRRPGTGIAPKFLNMVVGNVAKSSIKRDELLTKDKLEVNL